jgi:hypothetical protein
MFTIIIQFFDFFGQKDRQNGWTSYEEEEMLQLCFFCHSTFVFFLLWVFGATIIIEKTIKKLTCIITLSYHNNNYAMG